MTRSYPNSETIQPRFAAWLGSLGLDITPDNRDAALHKFGSWSFMEWIGRCRASAPKAIFTGHKIRDHDAFTEHCWSVAFGAAQVSA